MHHRVVKIDRDGVGLDEATEVVGDQLQQGRLGSSVVMMASVRRSSSCWLRTASLQGGRLRMEALRGGRGPHGLGRERAVDLQQPQVVGRELVQAELGQDDHAEDAVLELHGRHEQRLVEVLLGARDGLRAGVAVGVRQVSGRGRARPPSR